MLECYTNDKQFEAQIIMPEIILRNQSATMQVNTMGGYIDSLILKGREVLFPKTSVQVGDDTKLRGGMHVCLPQFGPDSKNHLAQHDFGRTSDWEIRHQNESDIGLKLISTEKGYEHVEWLLDYSLPNENEAIAILTVCNYGESPIRTSPGFHPTLPPPAHNLISTVRHTMPTISPIPNLFPPSRTHTLHLTA